ncbi:MAG: hypothetical protein HY960_15975 [Ignavibacteriae bacterium]|nr:hypothetical protein [Ignavibacteriota bacterium]
MNISGKLRMSLYWRLIATIILFFSHSTFSQDILELFVTGDSRYRMLGDYPFVLPSQEKSFFPQVLASPTVQFEYRFNNVYRETHSDGTETLIENYSKSGELQIPLAKNSFQPIIGVQVISQRSVAKMYQSPTEGGNYDGTNNRVSFSYAMRLSNTFQFSAMVGQSFANPQLLRNYESTISVQVSPEIRFHLNAGSVSSSQSLWLNVTDINGVLPLDYQMQKNEASLTFDYPLGTFILSGKHANIVSVPDASREWETKFIPQGRVTNWSLFTFIPLSEKWLGMTSYEQDEIEGSGRFLSRNKQYGNFSTFNFPSSAFRLGARYQFSEQGMFEADIHWRMLSGTLNGSLDSWPFLSVFDMPLGLRENFEGIGSLKFWKFHVSSLFPFFDNIQAGVGVSGLIMFPALKIRSWESRFLSYGVRALQERELAIQQLDVSILSAGVKGKLFDMEIQYSVNQFIPLRIIRNGNDTRDESGSTGSGGTSSSASTQSDGGRFHQLRITYLL